MRWWSSIRIRPTGPRPRPPRPARPCTGPATSRRSSAAIPGKGEALWKSLLVTEGDLLVFIDADLTQWGPHFVTGLLGPLLADPGVQLVKGFYARIAAGTDGSASTEGGRVTELVARPLLSLWWPELSGVVQPLAGEWAARRELMESLSIPVGYGVELSTLLDTAATRGLDAIAQVDLGSRGHKHQTDHDLALMAAELLIVAERRRPGLRERELGREGREPGRWMGGRCPPARCSSSSSGKAPRSARWPGRFRFRSGRRWPACSGRPASRDGARR